MLIKCSCCNQLFQVSHAGWWVCPMCHTKNYISYPAEKNQNMAAKIILFTGIGFLAIMFIAIIICTVYYSFDYTDNEDSYYSESEYKSFNDIMAENYLNQLPAEQKDAILHGGSSADTANALTNLMKSGMIDEVADYLR